MNLKIHSRTAVKDSGAGASTCSCASLVQEGPGRLALCKFSGGRGSLEIKSQALPLCMPGMETA